MKVLSAAQIRALDAYTIENEPISSIDLMERASSTFANWFTQKFQDEDKPIYIFCGIGNNGGDGLAVARLLHQKFYNVQVYVCQFGANPSPDFNTNLERLPARADIPLIKIEKEDAFPNLDETGILIDAIFGSGLNRPVEGYWAALFEYLNQQAHKIVSIDIPSGVFADQTSSGTSIEADSTFSFEFPKLAFFFPENQDRLGDWTFETIQLHPTFIETLDTKFHYVDLDFAKKLLKKRSKFDHKGTYGHALLIMGSYGKIGAAVLAAKACLRVGTGLVSVHAPKTAYDILQISIPEAMVSMDEDQYMFTNHPDLSPYKAIGIGCGLGKEGPSALGLKHLLEDWARPILLDADALNILSMYSEWYDLIPKESILTPHPKEFERLFGSTSDNFERNTLQTTMAQQLGCYIVLKGANTCIACPDGTCYFNSTGNPGMATAGSGDVLSGIITGLLAQRYSSFEAAILGVYLHGLAGDLGAASLGEVSLIAGDITSYLSEAFNYLNSH